MVDLYEYLDILELPDNRAGGGSVAAISGALASALILKAYNMIIKKDEYAPTYIDSDLYVNVSNIRYKFYANIWEDGKIFGEVVEAYKLPKSNEEEILYRNERITEGYKKAYKSTYTMLRNANKLFESIFELNDLVDEMSKSELDVSVAQIDACIKSSLANLYLNLEHTKDEEFIEKEKNNINKLMKKISKNFKLYNER